MPHFEDWQIVGENCQSDRAMHLVTRSRLTYECREEEVGWTTAARKVKSKDGSTRGVIVWNAEYYSGSLALPRLVTCSVVDIYLNLLTFFTFRLYNATNTTNKPSAAVLFTYSWIIKSQVPQSKNYITTQVTTKLTSANGWWRDDRIQCWGSLLFFLPLSVFVFSHGGIPRVCCE